MRTEGTCTGDDEFGAEDHEKSCLRTQISIHRHLPNHLGTHPINPQELVGSCRTGRSRQQRLMQAMETLTMDPVDACYIPNIGWDENECMPDKLFHSHRANL
jgi:hypothetical protein